jgi:hypothetical protein
MMADSLLHQGATILCMHAGQAQPTVTSQRVKVSNQPIVTQSSTYSIAGCTLPTQAGGPCTTAQWVSAATRVRANGVPVLMKGGQAVCTPTGTGLNVIVAQTRVKVT